MESRQAFDVFNAPLVASNLIEASAGTGKTWSITGLYLRMVVEQDLLPENILVVTFTKAATAELTGRIRQRLQQAMSRLNGNQLEEGDADFFDALFKQWETRFQLKGELGKDEIKQRLLKALARFDQAAIYTIHSFCQRLLNDYAFEAGAQFNLTPVTDSSEELDTIAQDFWRSQMQALSEDDTQWVEWLVANKQSPATWLKAVKDHMAKPNQLILEPERIVEENDIAALKGEIEKLQPNLAAAQNDFQTIQKECAQCWDEHSESVVSLLQQSLEAGDLKARYKLEKLDANIEKLNSLLTVDASSIRKNLTKEQKNFCQSELAAEVKKNREAPKHAFFVLMDKFVIVFDAYKDLKSKMDDLQKELKSAVSRTYSYRLKKTLIELLRYIDAKFPALKSELGIMDFDDMIVNIYQALGAVKGEVKGAVQGDVFASAVARQFGAALIDEFQDTDPLQLEIFQTLFAQTKTPLFYVGDPKQAIYSFRGADIYAYYQGANAANTQQTLLSNYRSTPALVDSVNALFSPKYRSFIAEDISFDWVAANTKNQLVIEGQSDAALQFVIAENEEQEPFSKTNVEPIAVANTVQQIADILQKAQAGKAYFQATDGTTSKVNPSDIAILVPTHKQAKLMAQALAKQGVMSVRQGQDKVLQSDAANTVLRLMLAIAEPGDESRVTELLADPLVAFSGPTIVAMKQQGHNWENLLEQFWQLKALYLESGFSAMFRSWLDIDDVEGLTLPQRLVDYAEGERNLTDLMHLAEILQQRSRQQISLKGLIHWLQYAINGNGNEDEHQLRLESDTQRVKIVTLHACKGLEYNIVFCPFLWQGKMFNASDIVASHQGEQAIVDFGSAEIDKSILQAEKDQFMEQLRLLYVALTRPVHRCVIFWAHVQAGQYTFTANSALAWLLYGDETMTDNPVAQLREKVKSMSFEAFAAGVEDFQKEADQRQPESIKNNHASISMEIIEVLENPIYVNMESNAAADLSIAALPVTTLYPSWLITSFSGLSAGQHASVERELRSGHADDIPVLLDDKEQNEEQQTDEAQEKGEEARTMPSIFTFPRGAMAGECLHSIFEDWDFSSTDKEALKTLVSDKMNRFSIAKAELRPQWYESVADAVLDTLNKLLKMSGSDFCLAKVADEDRQAELEFLLAARGSTDNIQQLLADPQYQLPQVFVDASKQLNNKRIQGFLTGFIDLVFKDDQGRYHVLDWKSNHLGDEPASYAPHLIEHAMAEKHYYLQALLYLLALHRYLQQQLPDYNITQHLGGAWYAFVRGVDIKQPEDEPNNGFYYYCPPPALIQALDQQLIKREAAA